MKEKPQGTFGYLDVAEICNLHGELHNRGCFEDICSRSTFS